jgi:signal peptidase I
MNPEYNPKPLPPEQESKSRLKSNRRDGIKSILSTVLILLIAPILAIFITSFVFQSYEVDGPSMEPTLQDKDRLIVWKTGRSWARVTNNDYIPERTSVIVFVKRGLFDFNSGKEKQLIKRVIGIPGDRVVVKDGKVTVYNSEHPNGFNPDDFYDYGKDLTDITEGNVDITVGSGEVFVMGDNRANSLDSREFGAIPAHDIVGTLSSRILPLSQAKKF